jgi:hypothetical protein
MAKLWSVALALLVGAGLWAAPAMAQSSDVDDVGSIQRGGAEHSGVSTSVHRDGGLAFSSDMFSLRMTNRVQVRFTHQQEVANGGDGTNGRNFNNFSVPRARTTFSGHIFEKEFGYNLALDWVSGGNNILREAWFRWAADQYLNVSAGQHKLPFNWEEMTDSGMLQFVDRSYTNEVFNQDYAKGIWIDGMVGDDVPMLKYWAGVYNGVLRSSSDFRNADMSIRGEQFQDGVVDGDMMINVRLETHPLGEVARRMNDNRSEAEYHNPLFAIGLGFNWLMGGFDNQDIRPDTAAGTPASGRSRTSHDTWSVVLDAHFRMYGFSADLEIFHRHTEFHNRGSNRFRPTTPARNGISNLADTGFSLQLAYFIIPQEFNVGLRYAMVDADEVWQGGSRQIFALRPDATEIGVSANYYIRGDNLKLTMDVLHVAQQLAVPLSGSLQGVYNDPPARGEFGGSATSSDYNNLWLIRLQLQWIF